MAIWYAHKNLSGTRVKPYNGECPAFFDLKGLPWFDKLTANLPEIKKKALDLLHHKDPNLKRFNAVLVDEGIWESQSFLVCNMPKKLSKHAGREVYDLFSDIPGVISVFISVLKPHTHVKAHNGDTDASYRLHIPVIIPGGLPDCGIKVDGMARAWDENEILVFCDAHMHEVWNHTDRMRVILIVDVVRQEYLSQTRKICNEVLTWLLLQQVAGMGIMSKLPLTLRAILSYTTVMMARPFLGLLQRKSN